MPAYTTKASVALVIGLTRLEELLDRDGDSIEDTGVMDLAIAEAGSIIDARLTQRLATPFAAITDTPATPSLVQAIARHLVIHWLYDREDPESAEAIKHWDRADGLLTGILSGDLDIPEASRQTAAKSRTTVAYSSGTPVFSGRDSYGNARGRGL